MYASHLNQCKGSGISRGSEPVLLRVVEPTAVDAPELARDAGLGILGSLRGAQREVEPDEVEGGADPCDPGDHVEHPQDDVEDVSQVRIHRSLAIATSSRQPVSSSSSRVRPSRSRSTSRISAFERRFTKTTKRNPNFGLVRSVQCCEVDEQTRIVFVALLGRRPRREPCPLTDRRMRGERLDLVLLAHRVDHVVRLLERVVDLGEKLDEPCAALEELAQLVDGQLPR